MIKKLFLPILAIFACFAFSNNNIIPVNAAEDIFVLELKENGNYKLVGISDYTKNEYRIYKDLQVDEVDAEAFNPVECGFSLMISDYVKIIDGSFQSKLNTIYYTGSEDQWKKVECSAVYTPKFYACDEGFINFWNECIRPNKDSNICAINRVTYGQARMLYSALNLDELTKVNRYVDKSGNTIGESMEFLNEYFARPVKPDVGYLPKSQTISIIVAVAIIGMSAIAGLYLLKKKKIIE